MFMEFYISVVAKNNNMEYNSGGTESCLYFVLYGLLLKLNTNKCFKSICIPYAKFLEVVDKVIEYACSECGKNTSEDSCRCMPIDVVLPVHNIETGMFKLRILVKINNTKRTIWIYFTLMSK